MSRLPPGIRRAFRLGSRAPRIDDEVRAEILHHLEQRTSELVARGWTSERAAAEAQRRFGNIAHWSSVMEQEDRERERSAHRAEWLDAVLRDVRYTARALRRQPLFTLGVVITLALGIGANATMFGIVDRLLFRAPEHVHDPGSVRRVYTATRVEDGSREFGTSHSYAMLRELRDSTSSFTELAAWTTRRLPLSGVGAGASEGRQAVVMATTASMFPLLGVRPYLGRFFTEHEDQVPEGTRVVVLGWELWRAAFGADSSVLGRDLQLGAQSYQVVGVAPPRFTGPNLSQVDAWIPVTSIGMSIVGPYVEENWWEATNVGWLSLVGRLRPQARDDAAAAELTVLQRRVLAAGRSGARLEALERSDPAVLLGPIQLERGPDRSESTRVATWLLLVSGLVLLIACANVANLLLARGIRRGREMAVRVALGAGRGGLLRQLLIESVLLAMLGGIAGFLVAQWGGGIVRGILLPDVVWGGPLVDRRVLLFTLAAALLTGVVAGMLPALRASRGAVAGALRAGAREGGGRRAPARAMLLVGQAALSVVLLVGSGLFLRSLSNVTSIPLGYDADAVLTLRADFGAGGYSPAEITRIHDALLERVQQLPGVAHASLTLTAPFYTRINQPVRTQEGDSAVTAQGSEPSINLVTADYFATMGTRIVRGRGFTADDREGGALVAVVNATLAQRLWGGRDPIGQCLRVGRVDTIPCREVVGVAEDTRWYDVRAEPGEALQFYLPLAQRHMDYPMRELMVRPSGNALAVERAVRAELRTLAPQVALARLEPLQTNLDPQLRSWRLGASMFTAFGVLALVLAAVGLYSVLAFTVAARAHEMGVRIALGAQRQDVLRIVVGDGLRVVAIGLAVGLGASLLLGRQLEALLFEVSPRDPAVFATVAGVLLLVALLASALPALRAARVAPATALRAE